VHNPGANTRWPPELDADIEVEIDGQRRLLLRGHEQACDGTRARDGGVGVAENMMSGTVIVEGNASAAAGATGRGGCW